MRLPADEARVNEPIDDPAVRMATLFLVTGANN